MKHLITAIASLIVLLTVFSQIFILEFANVKLSMADQAVFEFKEKLKQDGCMSFDNKENLLRKLEEIAGTTENINISGDGEVREYGKPVCYEIKIRMDRLMNNKFAGEELKGKFYTFKGEVKSCAKDNHKETSDLMDKKEGDDKKKKDTNLFSSTQREVGK